MVTRWNRWFCDGRVCCRSRVDGGSMDFVLLRKVVLDRGSNRNLWFWSMEKTVVNFTDGVDDTVGDNVENVDEFIDIGLLNIIEFNNFSTLLPL